VNLIEKNSQFFRKDNIYYGTLIQLTEGQIWSSRTEFTAKPSNIQAIWPKLGVEWNRFIDTETLKDCPLFCSLSSVNLPIFVSD